MTRTTQIATALAFALFVGAGAREAQAQQPFLFGAYPAMPVDQFETMIGHTIALDICFQKFDEPLKEGVGEDVLAGRTPLISWVSNDTQGGSVLATDILGGKYNQLLNTQAAAIAALGGTVLVEWQPEMTDNPRNAVFMTGVAQSQWGPTYIAVWIYIHDIFVAQGATNVKWVWSPGGNAYQPHRGIIGSKAYFPGTAYVDWMGLHSYNKSNTPMEYSANPEFLAFYAAAPLWAPGLPLIHSQTAATSTIGAQAEWIESAQSSLKAEFPLVRGWGWFNADQGTKDYALSGQGLTDFSAMAADPYYQ